MDYRTMRKVSFDLKANEAEIQKVYMQRLESPSACVLPFDIEGFPAFFIIEGSVLNRIAEIYKKNTDLLLLQTPMSLPGIAVNQYSRSILIDEIGLTNEMENIHSTRREIEDSLYAMEGNGNRHTEVRFAGMVEKYNRLTHGDEIPLSTCQDVRMLYDQLVLDEVVKENPKNAPDGQIFRKGPVSVRNTHDICIHEGIYPENRIIQAMDIALRFLQKQEYNPLIRIAVFHYLFAYIHPFYDGNGRMTRFISSYFLSRELCPLVGLKLSSAIKAEQSKYNKLFKETNEKRNMGDLTGFILGFLRFVSKSIDEIYDFLTETKVLWERTKRILSKHPKIPKRNDALLILCQNALFSESGLTIHDLVQITGKSRSTIDHELDIYVKDWKVLNAARKGRWIVYRLDMNKLLDYLSQDSDDM